MTEPIIKWLNKKRSNSSGLLSNIDANDRKRLPHLRKRISSRLHASTQREVPLDPNSLPMCTTGWSTIDCNEYGDNLSTIAGTVKPFLKDGNIPIEASKHLVSIIEFLLGSLPSENLFNNGSSGDETSSTERMKLQRRFKSSLMSPFEDHDCGDSRNFRVDGITILIPSSIGIHTDNLNCNRDGMTSVLSINCQIPMNLKTIPSGTKSKLWSWLIANGYEEYFNCSIICYSRKCVGNFVSKVTSSYQLDEKDNLRKCLNWALTERVGSVVDYRSRIWNCSYFHTVFRTMKKRRSDGTFQGEYMVAPACYDKIVSYIVKCHFNLLFISL